MKRSFAMTVLLSFVVGCLTASEAVDHKLKQYLNIQAPETALNAPFVFTRNGQTTLIGLYYRGGKRDVSAMQFQGDTWQPLGDNGLEITGVDGNFLSGIAVDKNGTPWLLTYYTRPSNRLRADRFYLYTLHDNRWVLVGPHDGHKADYTGGATLVMYNGTIPVIFYRTMQNNIQQHRILVLRDNRWSESSLGVRIPADASVVVHANRVFLKHTQDARLFMWELTDVESRDLPEARYAIDLPDDRRCKRVYFHNGALSAMQLNDAESRPYLVKCIENDGQVELEELAKPDDNSIIGVQWTRDHQMMVATNDLETTRVYSRTSDETWNVVASATEPSGAMLDFAEFTMLDDDTPIVTWQAFFPH